MLAKELYSVTAAPIVNAIFSLKWSEDDHISVITDTGVHTLELVPTPLNSKRVLQLNRSYAYPSDTLPAERYSNDINSYIMNWDREQVYTLLLESAISPKVQKTIQAVPTIIDVAWSPKGLIKPSNCMLAILTSVGAVDIAIKINRQWFSIHDLSNLWSKTLEESSGENDDYAMYVAKARRLQATSVSWSELQKRDSEYYAFLAVAYRSCDLVIWKVKRFSDNDQDCIKQVEIVNKTEFNSDANIRIMQWIRLDECQFLLFIGYHDGRMQCIKIKDNLENSTLNVENSDDYLMESDRIPVSSIILLKKNESNIDIIVTKGHYLIYLNLLEDGSLNKSLNFRNPGFQISGATVINSKEVLTFSENGKLTVVTILSDEIQSKPVKHEIISNRLRCLGLSGSTNKILFITVSSPNTTYDHLVNREPSTIHFFSIDDERKDPFNILLNEQICNNLGSYWDCLEVLRMKLIDDPNYSESICTRHDLECISFGLLKITMWINVIKQNCDKTEKRNVGNAYNCNEAKSLIFLYSASNIVLRLAEKTVLTEEEKNCIGLLKVYLEVYLGINNNETLVSKTIRNALDKIQHLQATREEPCSLCNRAICDSSSTTALCPAGHKLPRCALTLSQIRTVKFRMCPICKLMFHLAVENIWEEPTCLYCDVALVYDTRISGIKSKGNMKNLSKASSVLQTNSGQANNGMDDDESYVDATEV